MKYTVGLDFGTHQTKICIESDNGNNKSYFFFEFEVGSGKTLFFPSIVQINQDETISYGSVDENNAFTESNVPEPKLSIPVPPSVPKYPKEPKTKLLPPEPTYDLENVDRGDWQEWLRINTYMNNKESDPEYQKWAEEYRKIERENTGNTAGWNFLHDKMENEYNAELKEYEILKKSLEKQYEKNHEQWQQKQCKKLIFRYFKQATFTNSIHWNYSIEPSVICVWYITYILFLLEDKCGKDFYLQMGIPRTVYSNTDRKDIERLAFKILIAAKKLVCYYKDKDTFLKAKYSDLKNKTSIEDYTEDQLNQYNMDVMPEAYAGLCSIIKQGRLAHGMHLLVDIGGGTTDVAFFTITDDAQPNIHVLYSFPQGLNYIFEKYRPECNFSLSEMQRIFSTGDDDFKKAIEQYHNILRQNKDFIVREVEDAAFFRLRQLNIPRDNFRKAIKNQPIVYCGGGATDLNMRISLEPFTDIRLLNKNFLNIPSLDSTNIEDSFFPILATSYGLAATRIGIDGITIVPIDEFFRQFYEKYRDAIGNNRNDSDYHLQDHR